MRPQKRIDRTPRKAAKKAQARAFQKGRHFVPPDEVRAVDEPDDYDEVAPLPTAGEAPSKWELRSGLPVRDKAEEEALVDLTADSPTVDLRTTVRIVDGTYYERRTAGFRSNRIAAD